MGERQKASTSQHASAPHAPPSLSQLADVAGQLSSARREPRAAATAAKDRMGSLEEEEEGLDDSSSVVPTSESKSSGTCTHTHTHAHTHTHKHTHTRLPFQGQKRRMRVRVRIAKCLSRWYQRLSMTIMRAMTLVLTKSCTCNSMLGVPHACILQCAELLAGYW